MLCYSLRTSMSRWFWPVVRSRPWMMRPQLDAEALSRLAQRRLWLESPIRERQTFPHLAQVWMVARSASLLLDFRLALFSPARVWICSSPALSCFWSVRRAPTAAVSCHVFTGLGVDVQGFRVALADILVVKLGTAYRSLAWGTLAKQDVLWYAPIFHPAHVVTPAKPSLVELR